MAAPRPRLRDELRIRRDVLELRKVEKMMQNVMNHRWFLAAYPEGMPTLENWTLDGRPGTRSGAGSDPGQSQMDFRRSRLCDRQKLRQADRKDQLKLVPPAQWLWRRGVFPGNIR